MAQDNIYVIYSDVNDVKVFEGSFFGEGVPENLNRHFPGDIPKSQIPSEAIVLIYFTDYEKRFEIKNELSKHFSNCKQRTLFFKQDDENLSSEEIQIRKNEITTLLEADEFKLNICIIF